MRDDEPITPVDVNLLHYEDIDLFDPDESIDAADDPADFGAPASQQAAQPVDAAAQLSRKAREPAATESAAGGHTVTSSSAQGYLIWVGAAVLCCLGAALLLMVLGGSERTVAAASVNEGALGLSQAPPGATDAAVGLDELYAAFGHRVQAAENRMEAIGAAADQQRGVLDRIEGSVRELSLALKEAVQTIGAVEGRLSDVERDIRRLDGMVEAMSARPERVSEGSSRGETAAVPGRGAVTDRPRAWRVIGVMEDRAFVRDVQTGDYQSVEPGTHLPGAGIVRSISSHGQCAVTMEDGSRICNNRIER